MRPDYLFSRELDSTQFKTPRTPLEAFGHRAHASDFDFIPAAFARYALWEAVFWGGVLLGVLWLANF